MQLKRIVYFQQNLAFGACEDYFCLLMEGIAKDRFAVTFACPDNEILEPLVNRAKESGAGIHRYFSGASDCLLILRLWKFFRKIKPEIVHFNDPCLNGIVAARLAGVPKLIMTHHTPELDRKYNFKGKIMEKIAFRFCRLYFIFTSEYDRQTGIKKDGVLPDRSFVVPYGLPLKRFEFKYDKKEVRAEFSIPAGCCVAGNIARLNPQKGQKYLIAAASLIIKRIKLIKFFIVGSGELEEELKALVKEKKLEDYFIFTGHRNDIPRLLSVFDMLVMPSFFEGLCLAVLEASAMGVPVIATAVGGMRYSVVDGETGLLIPPRDPEALAEAVLWMAAHPGEAARMGAAGKKHFCELFTARRMLEETEKAYYALINALAG